ncbi:MAG: hypothetical protein AAF615_08340, partial [Pseudomonadota bacterium]
ERVPLQWAMTQNNLGTALQTLGERESDTTRLEAAVAAFTGALTEWTREHVPLYWATTQNNLAAAFLKMAAQAEQGDAAPDFARALNAVDAALAVFDEADSPHYYRLATKHRAEILARMRDEKSGDTGAGG